MVKMPLFDIDEYIKEDWLPLYERYKKLSKDNEEKKQEAINDGFEIVVHDENYVFLLQRRYSVKQRWLKSLHMIS